MFPPQATGQAMSKANTLTAAEIDAPRKDMEVSSVAVDEMIDDWTIEKGINR